MSEANGVGQMVRQTKATLQGTEGIGSKAACMPETLTVDLRDSFVLERRNRK